MNNLSLKYQIIIGATVILVSFAFGRYSVSILPATKSVVAIKTDQTDNKDVSTHKVTVIVQDCKNTDKKTTTITEDTNIKDNKDIDTVSNTTQTSTPPKTSKINISALGGLDTGNSFKPVYGISANKELLGPITVGAYGLTSGVLGISIGVNF